MKNIKDIFDPKINRRQFLQASVLSGASLMVPWQFKLNNAYAAESPTLQKFVDPLPIPAALQPSVSIGNTHYFDVQMAQITQQLHRDMPPTTVWGYGDNSLGTSFPGPTFEAINGENLKVTWHNNLAGNANATHYLDIDPSALAPNIHGATDNRKAVVHVHGGHVPQEVDGDPYKTFLPGSSVTYDYPIRQQAATLWYHDHALGITRLNVYMGMAGFFLVRDNNETYMLNNGHLPSGKYEIPLVLQDRVFKHDGRLSYDAKFDDMFLGDVLLVNGKVWPYLDVERRKYRFRLLNGSNSRAYTLKLPGNRPFYQIGSDGGFLSHPLQLTRLTLTPGERADIIIDFSQFSGGDDVVLKNTAPPMFGHPHESPEKDINKVLKFRVLYDDVTDNVELLHELVPGGIPTIPTENALSREFLLEDFPDPNIGDSKWLINGLGYDDLTEFVSPGTVELWTFVNTSSHLHPMHLHLVQFQVVSRYKKRNNGKLKNIGVDANEMGWKDTVRVASKEVVTVAAKFPTDPTLLGNYPYHCHILEHEDHEMMRQFVLG